MVYSSVPPMIDYTVKMMLLEAVKCYTSGDELGLRWLESQMFEFNKKVKELNRRG